MALALSVLSGIVGVGGDIVGVCVGPLVIVGILVLVDVGGRVTVGVCVGVNAKTVSVTSLTTWVLVSFAHLVAWCIAITVPIVSGVTFSAGLGVSLRFGVIEAGSV